MRLAGLDVIATAMKSRHLLWINSHLSPAHFAAYGLALSLLVSACAKKPFPPPSQPTDISTMPRTQLPYEIFGIRYYPIPSARGFIQDGIASWYGDKFHGRRTSNGEIYDMYAMTAAHKTLPIGTHVKVTNRNNGASVILRINDRGPFVASRIIDLSYTAARKLSMLEPGTIPVRVEAVQVARKTQVAGSRAWQPESVPDFRAGNFSIQLGAFQQVSNARKLQAVMQQRYGKVFLKPPSPDKGGPYYRIRVGLYSDLDKARQEAELLKQNGYPGAFVVAGDDVTS